MIAIPGYKILRKIGEGPMASVYLAIQESFEREVVLKVMHSALAEDSTFTTRFLRQARVVSRLIHPNIVAVHDVGVRASQYHLSMEYIPGHDLTHPTLSLTPPQSLGIVRDVAVALGYASNKGYLHGNLKPANILVRSADGRAIVLDFGIAGLAAGAVTASPYQAPERAGSAATDTRADIFSLGVVLFELLTGRLPEPGDSVVSQNPKRRGQAGPRLPGNLLLLQPIISKALAQNPNQRFQNAAELIAAIDAVSDEDIEAIQLATRHYATLAKSPQGNAAGPATNPAEDSLRHAATRVAAKMGVKRSRTARHQSKPAAHNPKPVQSRQTERTKSTLRPPHRTDQSDPQRTRREPVIVALRDDDSIESEVGDSGAASHSRRTWPWVAAAVLLVAGLGGAYSRNYLPPHMASVVEEVAQSSIQRGGELSAAIIDGSSAAWNRVKQLKFPGGKAPNASSDGSQAGEKDTAGATTTLHSEESLSHLPDRSGAGRSEGPGTINTSSKQDEIAGEALVSAKASRLRDRLDQNISLAPWLAKIYRKSLAATPDNREAQLGLRELRDYHYRSIREALQARELDRAKLYFVSLQESFSSAEGGIELESDENYQGLWERFEQLRAAQGHIAEAENQLAADAPTDSALASAAAAYQRALEIDKANPRAANGLQDVVERYRVLAEAYLASGKLQQAMESATRGLDIDADHQLLIELRGAASGQLAQQRDIERFSSLARQQLEARNYISPRGESAYDYYQEVLARDASNSQALRGISRIERELVRTAEVHINQNEFDAARDVLETAEDVLGKRQRLHALARDLERAEKAHFSSRQPLVEQLLVSSQGPENMDGVQKEVLNVDGTIYIAFSYRNFRAKTSVVQAMLYDSSRGSQIAQVPVIVDGEGGIKYFEINQPVEGFAEGRYDLDLLLDDKRLSSLSFQVAK